LELALNYEHAKYDFISRAKLTHTRPKSKTKSSINLHDSSCNPLDPLDFILLLISSNPLTILGVNKMIYLKLTLRKRGRKGTYSN